jgi:hypothetical protein
MAEFNFNYNPIKQCITFHSTGYTNPADWRTWRVCYEGGSTFVDEFLESYNGSTGQEGDADFTRRKALTPIPTYAKREINAVKNSIARRLVDVTRLEGSDAFQNAVAGNGRGVDLRGSSMNAYLTKIVLPELLVMGEVGVLVDAPKIAARSRADVPKTFQPYLNKFEVEACPLKIPAPASSPSDWSHVLLQSQTHEFNYLTGQNDCKISYRYYWLEQSRGWKMNVAFLDQNGDPTEDILETNLDVIPYVLFEIDGSLMADVCQHQIALLNMISADTSYGVDSNFPFLTRQRGATDVGDHLDGGPGDDTTRAGSQYGLYYNKGLERPGFISPPSEPLRASLELRRELKEEVHELVTGALKDLGDDGSIESGLAAIGEVLQMAETRLWDHWGVYEEAREDRRQVPTINYPETWSIKTDDERLTEADKYIKLANSMVGEKNKKQFAKKATVIMHRGTMSTKEMNALLKEIDESPIGLADPDVIIKGKKEGIFCSESAAAALGAKDPKKEAEQCQKESAERAAQVVAAQTDATAGGRGNPDGQADPNSQRKEQEGRKDFGRPTEEKETE